MSADKKNCFVIMPFSQTTSKHTKEYWTTHFNNFLKPLIEEIPNLEAHRSEALRGDILKQIINDLVVSPIVIADLTDKNANVFWELGVRESFKHGTVTIAEEGTKLPFDVFAKGTLFYGNITDLEKTNFKNQFKEAIQDCLSHSDRPDSHVLETLSGRGTLFEIFRRDESIRRINAVLSECDANLKVLDVAVGAYRKNENKSWRDKFRLSRKIWFPVARFSTIAIELLVTHRYLDENKDFYEAAEGYLRLLVAMNGQIENYAFPDSAGDFILDMPDFKRAGIIFFRQTVAAARDKLVKLS